MKTSEKRALDLVKMFRHSRNPPRKVPTHAEIVAMKRKHTRYGRDEAVARYRADKRTKNAATKRSLAEVIASLSPEERAALAANEHVISAVEKILEAMLFRFS